MNQDASAGIQAIEAIRPASAAAIAAVADGGMEVDYGMLMPVSATPLPATTQDEVAQWQTELQALQSDAARYDVSGSRSNGPAMTVIPVGMENAGEQTLGKSLMAGFVNESRQHDAATRKIMELANHKDGLTLRRTLDIQTELGMRNNRLTLISGLVKRAGQAFQEIVKAQ